MKQLIKRKSEVKLMKTIYKNIKRQLKRTPLLIDHVFSTVWKARKSHIRNRVLKHEAKPVKLLKDVS